MGRKGQGVRNLPGIGFYRSVGTPYLNPQLTYGISLLPPIRTYNGVLFKFFPEGVIPIRY
jgi:hypothetical protein